MISSLAKFTANALKSNTVASQNGRLLSSLVSMDLEFPGTPEGAKVVPTAFEKKTATLSSGVKVVACETAGQGSSLSLVVGSGSKNESSSEYGSALMLKTLAFKQTTERSDLKITRDLEDVGAFGDSNAGRESISYSVSFPPEAFDVSIEALAETVLCPKMPDWEVQDLKAVANIELDSATSSPSVVLSELVHAAAYGEDSALGHTFYSPVTKINAGVLKGFQAANYVGSNMTLVGINLDLDILVGKAESAFASAPSGNAAPAPASPYVGGEMRVKADSPYTYVGLAYESYCPIGSAVVKAVLDVKLASNRFSTAPFTASYSPETGLLGVCGVCAPEAASQMIDSMKSTMDSLASLTDEDIALGKSTAALLYTMAAESAKTAPVALLSGLDDIQGVPNSAIKDFVKKVLSTPISLASLGDLSAVPKL